MPDTTPHQPTPQTRRTVESMSAYGIPQVDIARTLGMSPMTLRKYYREELDSAATKANAKVAELLYTAASGKALERGATWDACIRSAMFWAKTRMGWKETTINEVTGKDGGPIQSEDVTHDADAFARRMAGLAARHAAATGEADTGSEGGA